MTQIIFAEIWSLRLGVRTPGFHPGNRGSIPLGTATKHPLRLTEGVFFVSKLSFFKKPSLIQFRRG